MWLTVASVRKNELLFRIQLDKTKYYIKCKYEKMCNLSASNIFLYIEGVNGIKNKIQKLGAVLRK
jgi:hypothetical protein